MAKTKQQENQQQENQQQENQQQENQQQENQPLFDGGGETVKARVLVDGVFGKVNDIVEVPLAVAAGSDELDHTEAAVAYAESLQNGTID